MRRRRMWLTTAVLSLGLLLLLAVRSQAQEERWEFPAASQGDVWFAVDAAGFRGPLGKTHEEIYYLLTTEGLRLVRGEGGYRGSMEVTVLLRTSEEGEAARRRVQRTVVVDSLAYRGESPTAVLDLVPVQIPPGEYELVVTIRDLNGAGEGVCRGMLEVPAFDAGELSISDIQFASAIQVGVSSGKFVKNSRKVTPNPLRRFGPDRTSFPVYLEVYHLAKPNLEEGNTFRLRYKIMDGAGTVVRRSPYYAVKKPGTSCVKVQDIDIGALAGGTYTLRVDIKDDLDGRITSRSGVFQIAGSDDRLVMPMGEEDIDKYYDQIKYIATEEQLALFRRLSRVGKQHFLLRFWRSKDPTPETPENEFMIEHFRRMAFAEGHFTGHKGGVNTDMGRVYIVYGPPEEIERHSDEAKAYEIWYHSLQRKQYSVFVDQTGAGVYVLVHSSIEGEIHNPYWRDEVSR